MNPRNPIPPSPLPGETFPSRGETFSLPQGDSAGAPKTRFLPLPSLGRLFPPLGRLLFSLPILKGEFNSPFGVSGCPDCSIPLKFLHIISPFSGISSLGRFLFSLGRFYSSLGDTFSSLREISSEPQKSDSSLSPP